MEFWQALVAILGGLFGFSYATNPFSRWTIVRRHYRASLTDGVIQAIDDNHKLHVSNNAPMKVLAALNNAIYIIWSRWHKRPTSSATTVEAIIDDIYRLRFDPNKLLLTSGDHFSSLFVRNLGVFYYPTLDTHLPASEEHWQRRQLVYLQTVAYALGVFAQTEDITTTIVPTGRYRATCVNFHAYPSDTMYGILYALAALTGVQQARPIDYGTETFPIDTHDAAQALLDSYHDSIARHYARYRAQVFDDASGLITKNLTMSGAKDITMRSSAFYDNVVFWKATELAGRLDIIPHDEQFLADLKQRILETFWREDMGYFLEDLSDEGIRNAYYSSDWLIVLATNFLDPENPSETAYFTRSIEYIQAKKIDRPFAIKYQADTRAHRQFPIVRLAVASYGGDSIWSFWGMEYIKALLALYCVTGDVNYLETADYHIDMYKKKMLQYGGYPETYDAYGSLLETPLYRSIIETGWVIGFEQVLAIRATIK